MAKYKEPKKEIKPKGVKQTEKMSKDIADIINKPRGMQNLRSKLRQEAKDRGLTKKQTEKYIAKGMQLAMNTPKKTVLK